LQGWIMLDVRQIRLVVTLAEHGNIVRAGRILEMSPSALTRAVTAIEERLGVQLFDRSHRGFEPTPVCRAIIAKGTELLAKAEELAAIVTHLGSHQPDRIVLSAGPAALDTVVSPAIATLLTRQSATQVQVLDGSAVDAIRALVDRRAALAIAEVSDLDNPEGLVITKLRRHPFLVLARRDHPIWALGPGVEAADIFRYPFIVPTYMSARFAPHVSAGVAAGSAARGGRPFPAVVADNVGVSLAVVSQSDALVACTARGALPHIRSGALAPLPWRPPWLETNFAAMRLRGARQTTAMRVLFDCLLEADLESFRLAQDLMPPGTTSIAETFAVVGRRTEPALTVAAERARQTVPGRKPSLSG
jgi:DNA-binding transcriptional LysR family regulator